MTEHTLPPKNTTASALLRYLADHHADYFAAFTAEDMALALHGMADRIDAGIPAVRGETLTEETALVEGMAVADDEGLPWWYLKGTWHYGRSPSDAVGSGITADRLANGTPLLITYVPEATS